MRRGNMYKVMFVDDDMIVRTMLHTIVDWNQYGFTIVGDARDGKQALNQLKNMSVDLLITDMKMPIMDGITLIKQIKELEYMPNIIVLSGYDEFHLVREAFRLGIEDYLLKSDINKFTIMGHIQKFLEQKKQVKNNRKTELVLTEQNEIELLKEMALGKRELKKSFFPKRYYIVRFEIRDFKQQAIRFGADLENDLTRPMIEIANQIPVLASKCMLCSLTPSTYLLLYKAKETDGDIQERVKSLAKQIIKNWKNYMNLTVIASISQAGNDERDFIPCIEKTEQLLSLQCIFEKTDIFSEEIEEKIKIQEILNSEERYALFINHLKLVDDTELNKNLQVIFTQFYQMKFEQAQKECLYIIYHVARMLRDNNDDILSVFQQEIDYYDKIQRLYTVKELEIWMTNYVRWIMDYMEHNYERRQTDIIQRAKRFIWDNYANPELSLGNIADFVGLNEKYFSTRFTKETGSTFSGYLMSYRIEKAKELIRKTDLKVYEISQKVGYNSVEHFNRIFKKMCHMSPMAYKKSDYE